MSRLDRFSPRQWAAVPALSKVLLPAVCAALLIAAIEGAIQLRYHPGFWQKTAYLLHDPYKGESFDRSEVYIRLGGLEDSDPDIISVGDSSGFFSLQSQIVRRYTRGLKYISFNTGANHDFAGYQGIAEYMLRRSPHLKYVVLYLYPQLVPSVTAFSVADLGPILDDDLVGPRSAMMPPSAFLSPYAKKRLFENSHFSLSDLTAGTVPVREVAATLHDDLGWLPEFDIRFDRQKGLTPFYSDKREHWYQQWLSEPSTIYATFADFDRMVESYGAQLVIAFAPMPTTAVFPNDPNIRVAEKAIARFQNDHPNVKIPFPLITGWGSEKFGMYNHISREYTFLSSERLGLALGHLIADPQSIRPFEPSFSDEPRGPLAQITPTGPPDPDLLKSALALYLYSFSAEGADRFSRRVSTLLSATASFKDMTELIRARNASLGARHIEFGYDLSQLTATPVNVTNLPFCASGPATQWVHVGGTMIFTSSDPRGQAREPVSWPASSSILIPTLIEDGVRKFDGYCPERPWLRDHAQSAPDDDK